VRLDASHHPLTPPILNDAFGNLRTRAIESVERSRGQVAIELRTIRRELRLKSVEYFFGDAARIGRGFDHEGRHRDRTHSILRKGASSALALMDRQGRRGV
jgi:hypothetical protein